MSETICIAIPVLGGVPPEHPVWLSAIVADLRSREVNVEVYYRPGDAMICRARNAIAARFLRGGADLLFMLDSDIHIPSDAIDALRRWNVPVVGLDYRQRSDEVRSASVVVKGEGGLVPAHYLATGAMLIRRTALEAMIEYKRAHGDYNLPEFDDEKGHTTHGFFVPFVTHGYDRTYLSEDWAFSERLRTAGIEVFLDTTIRTRHIGRDVYA